MTGPSVIDWNLIWSQWAHRGHRQHRQEILNDFCAYAAPKRLDLVAIPLRAPGTKGKQFRRTRSP